MNFMAGACCYARKLSMVPVSAALSMLSGCFPTFSSSVVVYVCVSIELDLVADLGNPAWLLLASITHRDPAAG